MLIESYNTESVNKLTNAHVKISLLNNFRYKPATFVTIVVYVAGYIILYDAIILSIIVGVVGGLTGLSFALAVVRPPRVVASLGDTPLLARVNQTIRTVVQLRLTIHAFPITVAVSRVRYHLIFGFAWVFLYVG